MDKTLKKQRVSLCKIQMLEVKDVPKNMKEAAKLNKPFRQKERVRRQIMCWQQMGSAWVKKPLIPRRSAKQKLADEKEEAERKKKEMERLKEQLGRREQWKQANDVINKK